MNLLSETLTNGDEFYTQRENLHRPANVLQRWKCRCNSDVAIVRIQAVWKVGAGRGQSYPRFGCEGNDLPGAAIGHVEIDEITASRLRPMGKLFVAQFTLQNVLD